MTYENIVTLSLEEYLSMRDRTIKADMLIEDIFNVCNGEKFLIFGDILNVLKKYADDDDKARIDKIEKEHA